jgi:hypothetical protein
MKPNVTWFIDFKNQEQLKQVRDAIYRDKDKHHTVVISGNDQTNVDMFTMDWMHAPATNFHCVTEEAFFA